MFTINNPILFILIYCILGLAVGTLFFAPLILLVPFYSFYVCAYSVIFTICFVLFAKQELSLSFKIKAAVYNIIADILLSSLLMPKIEENQLIQMQTYKELLQRNAHELITNFSLVTQCNPEQVAFGFVFAILCAVLGVLIINILVRYLLYTAGCKLGMVIQRAFLRKNNVFN